MIASITTFSGHLHPLIVHLPIGFILLAAVFDILSYRENYKNLKPAVSVALLTGFLSALLACLFGYVLSLSGDYDRTVLTGHKLSGITLAVLVGVLYYLSTSRLKAEVHVPEKLFSVLLIGLIVLMSYSGHQGASLTHGRDYLSLQTLRQKVRDKPASVQQAMIFEDVVAPILENKCAQCHREGKLKGGFSVASLPDLLKGGKNGPAVVPGKLNESELYKRITLEPEHKDYMPADGKPPLTKTEVQIIDWWIAKAAAAEGKTMARLKNAGSITRAVETYLGLNQNNTNDTADQGIVQNINRDIPMQADTLAMGRLRSRGLMIRLMLKKPMMLDITLPANSGVKIAEIKDDLMVLAKHIVWLNFSANNFTDNDLNILKFFVNMEKLRIEKNPVTDELSKYLVGLKHMEAVNLNETKITGLGVRNLKKNPAIKRIYTRETVGK